MKISVRSEVKYTIELSETEAGHLMALVQNAVSDNDTGGDTDIRRKIWDALESEGLKPR